MYEAFWNNSDFIRSNIIMAECNGEDIGAREDKSLGEKNALYQLAQVLHKGNVAELKTFPLPEKVIDSLQLASEELQELAMANQKRMLGLLHRKEPVLFQPVVRRSYGRK